MDFEGNQTLISISISSIRAKGNIKTDFFTINPDNLKLENGFPDKVALETETKKMWLNFFKFLSSRKDLSYQTIFVHNLGGFDGVFIFTQLARLMKPLKPSLLLDESNKFI